MGCCVSLAESDFYLKLGMQVLCIPSLKYAFWSLLGAREGPPVPEAVAQPLIPASAPDPAPSSSTFSPSSLLPPFHPLSGSFFRTHHSPVPPCCPPCPPSSPTQHFGLQKLMGSRPPLATCKGAQRSTGPAHTVTGGVASLDTVTAEVVASFDINDCANDVYEWNFGRRPRQVSQREL